MRPFRPVLRMRRVAAALTWLALVALLALPLGPLGIVGTDAAAPAEEVDPALIVVLTGDVDPAAVARQAGVRPQHFYRHVINGFAGRVPAQALEGLRRNPHVVIISEDAPVQATKQQLPAGVDRVDADRHPGAGIGSGAQVDADAAVLDTGIDASHADLTVAGGTDCTGSGSWADRHGHGTHVAGTMGAKDDTASVVGVAPGVRLWAIKVLGDDGGGSWSSIICSLDWVVKNKTTIDVVNMSLGGPGSDGTCGSDALHRAICNTVDAGVPVVVAPGNAVKDAATTVPATYDEVITVPAVTDFDGKPGGTGVATCVTSDRDDRFAPFSNYGVDVDIAAPGRCVRSTTVGGGTGLMSGTSMAAPHVAGAVALYRAATPGASAAQVRNWLLTTASRAQGSNYGFSADPDAYPEPILNLDVGATQPADPVSDLTPTEPAPVPPPTGNEPLTIVGYEQSKNSTGAKLTTDGDPTTAWRTTTSTSPRSAWVRFDLGQTRSIREIRWQFSRLEFADRFEIQVSSDGSSWQTLDTRGNEAATGTWETLVVEASGRYLRFLFRNPNKDPRLGFLSEVELVGTMATGTGTVRQSPPTRA